MIATGKRFPPAGVVIVLLVWLLLLLLLARRDRVLCAGLPRDRVAVVPGCAVIELLLCRC